MKGPDSSCVPLWWECHSQYDAGRERFEAERGVNLKKQAAIYYRMYLEGVESPWL